MMSEMSTSLDRLFQSWKILEVLLWCCFIHFHIYIFEPAKRSLEPGTVVLVPCFWIHSMKSWETWRSSGCRYITSRSGCFFHLSKSKMFDSIEYWGIWWRSEINFKTLPRWTLLEPVICILCSQSVIQNGRRCGIRRDFSICPTSQALGDVCNLGKAPRHPFWETPKMRTRQWRSRTSLCHQLRRHGNSQGSSRILRDWTNCFSIIHWSNPWSNPQRHRISQHSNINKRTPSFGGWQLR